jgi:uncharacterized protein (DUF433 family)
MTSVAEFRRENAMDGRQAVPAVEIKHPIYRKNPVEIPAYRIAEAAHYLLLPAATLRSWLLGRKYPTELGQREFRPIVPMADKELCLLSFRDLAELHVLAAMRRKHRVRLPAVRKAIAYLRKSFGTDHPLSDQHMLTDGKELFIERYGQLVSASAEGQMAMKQVLEAHLQRIERDHSGTPIRLYPFTRSQIVDNPRSVVIDPRIQFGRPCLADTGIPTAIIAERYLAGDSMELLARDYERQIHEIEEAIRYESRAA